MKRKLILGVAVGLLGTGSWASWGQRPAATRAYTMRITAITGVSSKEFQIKISRTAKEVRLWYGKLDSVRWVQFRADPDYVSLDEVKAIDGAQIASLVEVMEKYKVFTQDSLRLPLSNYQSFIQLLDSVSAASSEALEQRVANRNRMVLDGTSVYVEVAAAGQAPRGFGAQSPRPATHPLLYRLLHESLQLYRAERPNSFLTPKATSGY